MPHTDDRSQISYANAYQYGTPEERWYAVIMIGASGMDGFPVLKEALGDSHPKVRRAAVECLLNIDNEESRRAIVGTLVDDIELAERAIEEFSPRLENSIVQVLRGESLEGRCDAAEVLFNTRIVADVVGMHEIVAQDPVIRALFIMKLGESPGNRTKDILIRHLRDKSPEVRFFAAEGLKNLGKSAGEAAELALGELVESEENPDVLNIVFSALSEMECPIPPKGEERLGELDDRSTRESRITWLLARRIERQMGLDEMQEGNDDKGVPRPFQKRGHTPKPPQKRRTGVIFPKR